jgi:hypothetical protein
LRSHEDLVGTAQPHASWIFGSFSFITYFILFSLSSRPMPPRVNRHKKRTSSALETRAAPSSFTFDIEDLVTLPQDEQVRTFVDRASADGRGFVRETVRVDPPSPVKRARVTEPQANNASEPATSLGIVAKPEDFELYTITMDGDDGGAYDPPAPAQYPPNPKHFLPAMHFYFIIIWILLSADLLKMTPGQVNEQLDAAAAQHFSYPTTTSRRAGHGQYGRVSGLPQARQQPDISLSRVRGWSSALQGLLCRQAHR